MPKGNENENTSTITSSSISTSLPSSTLPQLGNHKLILLSLIFDRYYSYFLIHWIFNSHSNDLSELKEFDSNTPLMKKEEKEKKK